ncbi:MAG: sulfotransferase family 2 domain-containing protein [Actinomycetes bacterium]
MSRAFPDWIEQQALVARDLKMIFVPTPKVGCTSIMWAMARAEGTAQPPSVISARGEQSREQTIHDPVIHGLPSLASLRPNERIRALEDPSWVRFCVTRDPYSRLLSGWVNRVLLNSSDALGKDLSFARESVRLDQPIDLGEAFRGFVRQLLGSNTPVIVDDHFAPQVSLIRPDDFPYTDIVKLKELSSFTARLSASSPVRNRFQPQAMNRSLQVDPRTVFDAQTAGLVDSYFADDFTQLGYEHLEFDRVASLMPVTKREAELISIVREKSDRLYDLQQLNAPSSTFLGRARRVAGAVRRRVRSIR